MGRRKRKSLEELKYPPKSQTYYIDGLTLREIMKDADGDDRSDSYIVNKILKEYYVMKGRLKE